MKMATKAKTVAVLDKGSLDTIKQINVCKSLLAKSYVERLEIINTLFESILSRIHVMLIGAPGTAKSAMLQDFVKCFAGMKYFGIQVMQSNTPEEVFGHLSIKALRDKDEYVRIVKGKLADCHFAYIDEVFHASSGLLQGFNEILNERTFQGKPVKLIIAVGATNFVPDDEQGLVAFYDRWEYRHIVEDIRDSNNFIPMLLAPDFTITDAEKISLEDLEDLQKELLKVEIKKVLKPMSKLRNNLRGDGIEFSARRWKWALNAIRAKALLDGRLVAEDMDMFCLVNILWEEKDQIPKIRAHIGKVIDPLIESIKSLLIQAKDISEQIAPLSSQQADENLQISEGMKNLTQIRSKISDMLDRKDIQPKVRSMVEVIQRKVDLIKQNIIRTKFGE